MKFPNTEKMDEFAQMIKLREPLADDVIGFMDGVSLKTECTVFDPEYEENAINIEGYDRIERYNYCPGDYETDDD